MLSYISFKLVPLCYCTLLPATVKMLETLLLAIVWKPFQLFRRILNEVSSIITALHFNADFSRRNTLWSARTRPGYYGGWDILVTLFFANESLTIVAGVLEHCRVVETTLGSEFFMPCPLTASLRRRRMSMYISLFKVAIPVHYTSELLRVTQYLRFWLL